MLLCYAHFKNPFAVKKQLVQSTYRYAFPRRRRVVRMECMLCSIVMAIIISDFVPSMSYS